MEPKTLYMAGPITGLSLAECGRWRNYVSEQLKPEIICYSPLRCKDYPSDVPLGESNILPGALSVASAIISRDRFDTINRDAFFANLLGATFVSPGTCVEFGWADMARRPIIVVMEEKGNPYDHKFIRGLANFRVTTLEEGMAVARAILLP